MKFDIHEQSANEELNLSIAHYWFTFGVLLVLSGIIGFLLVYDSIWLSSIVIAFSAFCLTAIHDSNRYQPLRLKWYQWWALLPFNKRIYIGKNKEISDWLIEERPKVTFITPNGIILCRNKRVAVELKLMINLNK